MQFRSRRSSRLGSALGLPGLLLIPSGNLILPRALRFIWLAGAEGQQSGRDTLKRPPGKSDIALAATYKKRPCLFVSSYTLLRFASHPHPLHTCHSTFTTAALNHASHGAYTADEGNELPALICNCFRIINC